MHNTSNRTDGIILSEILRKIIDIMGYNQAHVEKMISDYSATVVHDDTSQQKKINSTCQNIGALSNKIFVEHKEPLTYRNFGVLMRVLRINTFKVKAITTLGDTEGVVNMDFNFPKLTPFSESKKSIPKNKSAPRKRVASQEDGQDLSRLFTAIMAVHDITKQDVFAWIVNYVDNTLLHQGGGAPSNLSRSFAELLFHRTIMFPMFLLYARICSFSTMNLSLTFENFNGIEHTVKHDLTLITKKEDYVW